MGHNLVFFRANAALPLGRSPAALLGGWWKDDAEGDTLSAFETQARWLERLGIVR